MLYIIFYKLISEVRVVAYGVFAEFYDKLTGNVYYKERADYLLEICKKFNHDTGITLDLACGTGTLTLELKRRGVDVYGIDGSQEMLSEASMKAFEEELDVLFLCQKMQSIDLYGTIDTCFCTLDSINHMVNVEDVQKTFDRVSLFMNQGGLFVFDVNTVYKHREILKDNVFVFDTEDVYCVWQNTPVDEYVEEISLDFFIPHPKGGYVRESERFRERAYETEVLTEMLRSAGFEVKAVYDDMSFESPKDTEQRLYFVAEKL